jgi:hypothetical protein
MYGSGALRVERTGWALHKRQAFKRISELQVFDRFPGLPGAQAPSKCFLGAGLARCAASCFCGMWEEVGPCWLISRLHFAAPSLSPNRFPPDRFWNVAFGPSARERIAAEKG